VTLQELLPNREPSDNDTLLSRFLEYVEDRRLTLYPAQEEALLELFAEKNVILNTPTGSGKSLVAMALHFQALAQGKRSIYTCPVKALVNEKWLALCREFGPDNVGLSTGDASVNRDAPILCCTAEILANIALREGDHAPVQQVVIDEFHWYADRERGVAWQVPLLTLPQARFLLMSATLGDTTFFEEQLTRLNRRETVTVKSTDRPVPLDFAYSEIPLAQTVEQLVAQGKAPVYVVHFTQLEAAQSAQDFTSINVASREEKNQIANELAGFPFTSPYGPSLRTWLKHGIGIHHAGLLPKYRVRVEQLAQKGLLKVICGTDTLGVGVNIPIRTVLFTRLCKFDGEKTALLSARDFHQISGRAGRKGFDDQGWVVAQAPEHVIDNLKKAEKEAKGGKKGVKSRPPDRNFVNWDVKTFQRLMAAPPEGLTSRFQVSHAMLLNVLSRDGDGCRAMQKLIRDCHDSPKQKTGHRQRAWQLFRSLLDRKIIEIVQAAAHSALPSPRAPLQKLRVNVELQEDFSMDQTLSLYLIETLPHLDPESPGYALDLLTLVESILENPDAILRRQLDKVKAAAVAAMKADGMDYEQRMEELEKLEYPKPNRDFIYTTFNAFADKHPWVGQENIRPKSIAREMFENFRSFADYVRDYELQRAEGLLLRHLNSVYKVLAQTVPDNAKTEPVREMELYLRTMIREVDSSLLDEWEKLRDPNYQPRAATRESKPPPVGESAPDVTRDPQAFTAAVRIQVFTVLRALAIGDYEAAVEALAGLGVAAQSPEPGNASPAPLDPDGTPWTADRLKKLMELYHADHERLCLDPEARNARHTYVTPSEDKASWRVQQMLVDPQGHNDWVAEFRVDLPKSRETNRPVLQLVRLGGLA
jgi:superfamily II RNA helicase